MTDKGLLKGLTRAWLECHRYQKNIKGYALNQRPKGRFGIAVDNDIHALEYQISDYKAHRAGIALNGLTC